ncbi:MAG: bis(5'-nucleosyl)-tetraphosphatase (symmetrical) YqeK [Clostridia bacterium]|nr:bis(5'-nucleosyl)-tetraphosphatase (symmetrical) YqeK [Clostridia bacterium]
MKYEEIEKIVKETLSEKRYNHSVGVAKRAVELAKIYGEDEEKAKMIGIVHDIAKQMPKEEALLYAKENGIVFDEIEEKEPSLWHSKLGADIAKKKFGFTEEMAQAILYHTTGNVNMKIMDKIIYLADKTEEGRNYIDLELARNISNRDIDEGVLYVAKVAIEYSLKKNSLIHPDTIYLINQLIEEKENKK